MEWCSPTLVGYRSIRIGLSILAAVVVTSAGVLVLLRKDSLPPDAMTVSWAAYEYIDLEVGIRHPIDVTATDGLWSIDAAEDPDSILPFLTYGGPWDLTGSTVSVEVSGDVDLQGGYLRFWILGPGSRWHLDRPVPLGRPVAFSLDDGPWHRSWSRDEPHSLEQTLAEVHSYGLAFVGFANEVSGSLTLEEMGFQP